MTVMRTKVFGEVSLAEDGAYVPREPDEHARTSLYVAAGLSPARLDQAALLVDDIATLDISARAALVARIEQGDALVVDFVAFHRTELDEATASRLLGEVTTPRETVARLELVGVGVRADAFVLDYSFGPAHTDQLLVIAFDPERNVVGVMHES